MLELFGCAWAQREGCVSHAVACRPHQVACRPHASPVRSLGRGVQARGLNMCHSIFFNACDRFMLASRAAARRTLPQCAHMKNTVCLSVPIAHTDKTHYIICACDELKPYWCRQWHVPEQHRSALRYECNMHQPPAYDGIGIVVVPHDSEITYATVLDAAMCKQQLLLGHRHRDPVFSSHPLGAAHRPPHIGGMRTNSEGQI